MIRKLILIVLAGFILISNLPAQDKPGGRVMPLFQSDEILDIDLKADFKKIFTVHDDSTDFPGLLTVADNNGEQRTIEVGLRTRGKTRRESDVCTFPPLRISFPKKGTKETPFEGQKTLKLVTHCRKSNQFEQNTVVEYLIYKAFNVLTDSSFKVRAAWINYIYDEKKPDTLREFGFFIEKEKNLAERLNGMEIEAEKIHPNRTDPYQTCLVDMFQYMIGNTDYSIYELHNIILMSDSARKFQLVAIPYDFDWSGMISASYAVPHPFINTETVAERVYRGFKKEPAIVYNTIREFNAKKDQIYSVFENSELLTDKRKKAVIDYLDEFYFIINKESLVQSEFFDKARIVHD